jgi:MoxR-like ATPase
MTNPLDLFKFPTADIWPATEETPPYIFNQKIKIALSVALITRRPLLISGSPGSGKTTLARAIAEYQRCSFLNYTFTSRSRLEDLTGEIDQLQRLHDAHTAAVTKEPLMEDWCYYKPGLFWWGFDPELAMRRGGSRKQIDELKNRFRPPAKPKYLKDQSAGVVFLLDEIDKAEPDLPNDLLEPLDNLSFQLPNMDAIKAKHDWYLVIITTNGERELPPAFLRRCIALELSDPEPEVLVNIAEHHLQTTDLAEKNLLSELADKFKLISNEAKNQQRRQPGTSEYLDAVRACRELNIFPNNDDDIWQQIAQSTLRKIPQNP